MDRQNRQIEAAIRAQKEAFAKYIAEGGTKDWSTWLEEDWDKPDDAGLELAKKG